MQELVSDYTIVIVTHNMQQAARVSDRTAFFTVDVGRMGRARDGRRVRPHRDDLHEPGGRADRGLRHGEVRMMPGQHVPRRARAIELELLRAGGARRRGRPGRAVEALVGTRRRRGAGTRDRRRRRHRRAVPRHRQRHVVDARPAGPGRGRSAAGLGHPAQLPASRADRRPGGEHREDPPRRRSEPAGERRRCGGRSARWAIWSCRCCARRSRRSRIATSSCCQQLPTMDDPVDRLNRATHLEALKLADDPERARLGLHMNLAARALERVGDNAVDIGEQVSFLITGSSASSPTPRTRCRR